MLVAMKWGLVLSHVNTALALEVLGLSWPFPTLSLPFNPNSIIRLSSKLAPHNASDRAISQHLWHCIALHSHAFIRSIFHWTLNSLQLNNEFLIFLYVITVAVLGTRQTLINIWRKRRKKKKNAMKWEEGWRKEGKEREKEEVTKQKGLSVTWYSDVAICSLLPLMKPGGVISPVGECKQGGKLREQKFGIQAFQFTLNNHHLCLYVFPDLYSSIFLCSNMLNPKKVV